MPDTLPAVPAPGAVDLSLTSPDAIAAAVAAAFTGESVRSAVVSLVRESVDARYRELGIDAVDRRHLALPEASAPALASDGADLLDARALNRRRLDQWMRSIMFGSTPKDDVVARALSLGSDAAGGYLVPTEFIPEVIGDAPKLSALYQYCRQMPVQVNSGELGTVATNASVSWGSENTTVSEGDPAFGNGTWAVNRLNSLLKLSREVANDANPNIVEYAIGLIREKIVEERDRVIAIGTGSGQPLGLYSASGLTSVSGTTLTYEFLVNMHEAVDERYFASPSCRWVCNQTNKGRLMKLTDDNGQPLLVMDRSQGFRMSLFGHGISIESSLPDNFLFFGDLRYYMIFNREQLGVERSTEAGDAFAKHQLWVKFFERWDGRPILPPTKPMARCRTLTS